jgi:hypothetical protein
VGACASVVLARAMVRDLYQGDRAAQMLSTLFLKGVLRPAAHVDEVLVVHFHNVVEQRLSCLDKEAGDERIALS